MSSLPANTNPNGTPTPNSSKSPNQLDFTCTQNFQSFLASSPFVNQPRASFLHRKEHNVAKKGEAIRGADDDIFNIIDPSKLTASPGGSYSLSKQLAEKAAASPTTPKTGRVSSLGGARISTKLESMSPTSKARARRQSKFRGSISGPVNVFNQGFDSPLLKGMDKTTKKNIEGLQSRITVLERELLKVKKENKDLTAENKRYKDQMSAVIEEQNRAMKIREVYEKKISQFKENCQNNRDISRSLKNILNLQEGEYYDRIVKKERGGTMSVAITKTGQEQQLRKRQQSQQFPRANDNIRSYVSVDNSNDVNGDQKKPKSILKVDTNKVRAFVISPKSKNVIINKVSIKE